jgi:hypothetical protein
MTLLFASMFYVAFGLVCFFEATPREGASVEAVVALIVAAVFLFFGGLATELIFRRDIQRMDVNWRFFSSNLISHSHPFSEIKIRIRVPDVISPTGRRGDVGQMFYSADIGHSHYLLFYPESVPVCDAQLEIVSKELGVLGDSSVREQKTNDGLGSAQSSDPAFASGTSRAGHETRHR